jgi:hypothetical protein
MYPKFPSADPLFDGVHWCDTVDLTEYLREDTVLALPAHPRCDWDGSRICPGPKVPRQVAEEKEPNQPDVWAALDELNLKRRVNQWVYQNERRPR